ncbi:MAG: hypothetical protein HOD92_05070 [Deltaproteobacteria bacterium]|jgi:hypothetical protein|nr:hypothetical protein [Deltaproteobacteria bacterium]MBT4528109.1 hypothetical protein [Deltaproteobacteria bacterium]
MEIEYFEFEQTSDQEIVRGVHVPVPLINRSFRGDFTSGREILAGYTALIGSD